METVRDYDVWKDIWPERDAAVLAPVRVGMDRRTGKVLIGWPHTEQSIGTIFVTRYHDRILRQWVGSFVPHLLGRNVTPRTITRFFWAISTSLDLWEPNYRLVRVRMEKRPEGTGLTSAEEIRTGAVHFMNEGLHMPRGHLGDRRPAEQRAVGIVPAGLGGNE